MNQLTLITGATRGMGYELAKQLGMAGQHVLIGGRNDEKGRAIVDSLRSMDIESNFIELDVTKSATITNAVKYINDNFGRLDILINNAGIALDNYEKPSKIGIDIIRKDFDVNYFGAIDVTQQFLPLLGKSKSAKIINISSAVGSLTLASDPTTSIYQHSAVGYQSSKAALNMFTVDLANELTHTHISVNAVNPGWVATTFAGGGGDKSVQEGIQRTLELALSAENNITGTFSDTNGIVPW